MSSSACEKILILRTNEYYEIQLVNLKYLILTLNSTNIIILLNKCKVIQLPGTRSKVLCNIKHWCYCLAYNLASAKGFVLQNYFARRTPILLFSHIKFFLHNLDSWKRESIPSHYQLLARLNFQTLLS